MATSSVTVEELFNLIENGVLDSDDDEVMKSDSNDDEVMKSDQEDNDYEPEASDSIAALFRGNITDTRYGS